MTTVQDHSEIGAPGHSEPVQRSGAGLPGLAWLTWRQHRWPLLITGGLVAIATVALLVANSQELTWQRRVEEAAPWLLVILPVLVAVFWAAPLVAREYEQRTHLLAWSQDVSPCRWVLTKIALLAAVAAAMAGVLTTAATATPLAIAGDYESGWDAFSFESDPLLVIAYTVCGLAIGVAAGAVLRRTVPAMVVTLVAFAAVRAGVPYLRPHLLPPKQGRLPVDALLTQGTARPEWEQWESLKLDQFLVDAAGHKVQVPQSCWHVPYQATKRCLVDSGVAEQVTIYQPGSRIPVFRLIEVGIFLALVALLIAGTWYLLRRRRALG